MQPLQLIERVVPDRLASDGEVLSPESHVFVALMSVEEGPNRAVMLGVGKDDGRVGAASGLSSPALSVELPR